MTLHVCTACTSKFPPDLATCPHCGCAESHEEGTVPKITRHGGPSYAADIPAATEAREHPGTGVEMEEVEMTSDGDGGFVGEITNDGSGEALPPVDEPDTDDPEAEGGDTSTDAAPDAGPVDATLPRPATNAPKADWLAYAEQQTGEDIDADDYTKAELVELAGKA